ITGRQLDVGERRRDFVADIAGRTPGYVRGQQHLAEEVAPVDLGWPNAGHQLGNLREGDHPRAAILVGLLAGDEQPSEVLTRGPAAERQADIDSIAFPVRRLPCADILTR